MQPSCEAYLLSGDSYKPSWEVLVKSNCDALFQTALLLSANPETAEASVAATIAGIDVCRPPEKNALATLQKTVAMHTIQSIRPEAFSQTTNASSLLQRGLRPVLQIEQSSRPCFVMRMLLGYATSSSAQMLGMEEAGVRSLLEMAILQLHHAVVMEGSRDQHGPFSPVRENSRAQEFPSGEVD